MLHRSPHSELAKQGSVVMPRRVPKRAVNVRQYPLRDINRREGRAIQFSMPYPSGSRLVQQLLEFAPFISTLRTPFEVCRQISMQGSGNHAESPEPGKDGPHGRGARISVGFLALCVAHGYHWY